jgi:hypothetical protein
MLRTTLPFTIAPVGSRRDLNDVCKVRADAYGHHLPDVGDGLLKPDALDFSDDVTVYIARDKATGRPLGSARVQVNVHRPLLIEQCVPMPEELAPHPRAEITRLCVAQDAPPLVKMALYKTTFLSCLSNQVRYMVIGARSESLARQYKRLGFHKLYDGQMFPLTYAGGLEHMALAFNVQTAERVWFESDHAFYQFIFTMQHPDISMYVSRNQLAGQHLQVVRAA